MGFDVCDEGREHGLPRPLSAVHRGEHNDAKDRDGAEDGDSGDCAVGDFFLLLGDLVGNGQDVWLWAVEQLSLLDVVIGDGGEMRSTTRTTWSINSRKSVWNRTGGGG